MSVYKVVEIIGTSNESWEAAGITAVNKARESIRNLRVAEVVATGHRSRRGRRDDLPHEGARLVQVRRRGLSRRPAADRRGRHRSKIGCSSVRKIVDRLKSMNLASSSRSRAAAFAPASVVIAA